MTTAGATQPSSMIVLMIYHAVVCRAMRLGLGRKLAQGGEMDETDYLPMQEICWQAYCDVFDVSDNQRSSGISDTNLKRAIKDLLLKVHPDKVMTGAANDFRVHYASLAMTSFLNHASAWLKTTNINANSVDTGVDVLEMPLMLITNFVPGQGPGCSLPSHFELLASLQYAKASKASSELHRLNMESTKALAKKARYAEAIFWDKVDLHPTCLCRTTLIHLERPDTSHIPDISATGTYFPGMSCPVIPEHEKEIREAIRRLSLNDHAFRDIYLPLQDFETRDYMTRLLNAMRQSKCQIKSFFISSSYGMVSAKSMSQLFDYLATETTTIIELKLHGFFGFMHNSHIKSMANMIRQNTTIQTLSCGFLSVYTIDPIAEALRQNTTLKTLHLSRSSELYSEGVTEIANCLASAGNTSALENLMLARTGLTDRAVEPLVNLINNHSTLKHLDLQGNHFTEMGIQALKDAMADSLSLQELLVDPPTLNE